MTAHGSPAYLSGLLLHGRHVLMVGAGAVAERRLPKLIESGARLLVVAPEATPAIEHWAAEGKLVWERRTFVETDLDGPWYVTAATNDAAVNAAIAAGAEARRIFCVRADEADKGSAWTPATANVGDVTVGVIGNRDPRRSKAVREAVVHALASEPTDFEFPGGTVVLVGWGPGDPGLVTSAGLAALRGADVVVHDRLGPLELLAEARDDAEIIHVGKVPRGPFTPQEEINRILVDRAQQGLRVVRMKGGDNYVFGRGGEEWLACAEAGVSVRVIPGVTSAVSVPALAGIPVTHRGLSQGFCVVSGHVAPDDPRSDVDWGSLARSGLTIVILMGVANLGAIAAELIASGLPDDTPAAVVMDGTTQLQKTVRAPLSQVAADSEAADIQPPAIVVVGAVAGLNLE